MISSTSNAQIKNLILLKKKAKERNKQQVFLAEGRKMFEEAPRGWIRKVYVSETFFAEKKNQNILAGVEYEVLKDHVFQAVSDTQTPQGILSVLSMPRWDRNKIMEEKTGNFLFLESIQDPGNLGTMIRTGEGAGVTAVILNKTTVDVFNPKTIRSTMGSIYRIPVLIADDLQEAILDAKKRGVSIYAAHLAGNMLYDEPDYRVAAGFLIGNEGNGLSQETAALADCLIKIPMEGKVESLNAAIAAALLMYEVNRQRRG